MLAALCAVAAVACLAVAGRPVAVRVPSTVARLSTMTGREIAAAAGAQRPVWERLLAPAVGPLARRLGGRWAGMSVDDLRRAGVDTSRFGVADLLAVKVLAALAGGGSGLVVALFVPAVMLLVPAMAFLGFVLPSALLSRRRRQRHARMLTELPDTVGLTKAFVSAGIPLEQALHLISAQRARHGDSNLVAAEIRSALSDYGLGVSIEAALEGMARRVGLAELDMLVAALSQGKRQGAGMERILRDQETIMRLQQRNRAAAEASKVSNRLVGVLVLVYLPEFMVLIMVPLFYGIFLRAFG